MQKLLPVAKAIIPAVLTLIAALSSAVVAGKFDATSVAIAATGLIGSIVVYLVPNSAPVVSQVEVGVDTLFSPPSAGHPDKAPS